MPIHGPLLTIKNEQFLNQNHIKTITNSINETTTTSIIRIAQR